MRTPKKLPRKQIEKFSTVFTQLGLVLALFIVFVSLEHQTEHVTAVIEKSGHEIPDEFDIDKTPPVFVRDIPEPKVERPKAYEQPTKIDVVTDVTPTNTVIIKSIEKTTDESTSLESIKEIHIDEDIKESDEPKLMFAVEEIPVFAGCEGLSKKESRKCFDRKMNKLVQRYFDTSLGEELGLAPGKKRISAQFVIDKSGLVTDVKIRAPHPKLKKETQRILNKIPKFTPGKVKGKPVKVKYALPITFMVQ